MIHPRVLVFCREEVCDVLTLAWGNSSSEKSPWADVLGDGDFSLTPPPTCRACFLLFFSL